MKEVCFEQLLHVYDLHMHPSPSPFRRKLNDIELLQEAGKAGMSGILLKSHYESTADRASMANQYANSPAVAYGAVVLNWPIGGLNVYAVRNALKRGAKIVFMPTRDAENSLLTGNMPGDFFQRPGIRIAEDGKLKAEVYDIMDAVKEYNAVLATGHIAPEESILLCKEGRKRGVRMILTHPEFSRTKVPAKVQKELADMGVYIEKCWYNIAEKEISASEMAGIIQYVGAEHCFMTTDRGQENRETPVEAMKQFMTKLLEHGISKEQLYLMTCVIPQEILNLKENG